jgi:hypothetical protein
VGTSIVTTFLVRVSVIAAVEADNADDAIEALAAKVDEKLPSSFASVLTHKDEEKDPEFCPYSNCRCGLPHSPRSPRLSRYADACEAEADTEPDLIAPRHEPLRELAAQHIKRQKQKRTA